MMLSSRSRYGIRAVIELAMRYGKEPVPLNVISKKREISAKYLEQILNRLKGVGTIKTFRGPFGGYTLAIPPSEIKLSKIISVLEGPDEPIECGNHKKFTKGCCLCVTKAVFTEVRKRSSSLMGSITLQDLVDLAEGTKKDIG
jgi:Rrf2 family cysteine metabolism transcriptional repressor